MKALKNLLLMIWPGLIMASLGFILAPVIGFSRGDLVWLTFLLVGQNASFTLVSRSRQSNNFAYHAIASVGSNGFYILVQMSVITSVLYAAMRGATNWGLVFWYTVCTVVGSVYMHWLAVSKIEKQKHIKKSTNVTQEMLEARLREFEAQLVSRVGQESALQDYRFEPPAEPVGRLIEIEPVRLRAVSRTVATEA